MKVSYYHNKKHLAVYRHGDVLRTDVSLEKEKE